LILETVFRNWKDWAGAKVFAAIGIGGIQAALPVYVTELSPVNIRGGMIFIYAFWYTVGKVFANMVLMVVQEVSPDNYKIPILTQWGLLGIMLPVCLWIPESPGKFLKHPSVPNLRWKLRT
jgi:MFS family permease